jgi:hypothetical protein
MTLITRVKIKHMDEIDDTWIYNHESPNYMNSHMVEKWMSCMNIIMLKNLTTWKMCSITWLKFDGIHIFLRKSNSTLYAPWLHPSSTPTITTSMQIHYHTINDDPLMKTWFVL